MEKITLRFLLSISMLCFPLFGKAQEKSSISQDDKCLTDSYNAELLKSNPNMMGSEAFERILASKIAELKSQNTEGQRGTIITIPVVVHVLHNGEALGTGPNISDAQVQSQITVMNQDYRKMFGTPGYNTNPVGADIEIEFELAKRTPDGCPTNGINRVNICQDGTNQSDVQYWKTQTYWDPSKYMNMWSSKYVGDLNGILGYAQFPGGSANTDGVSASYEFFGSSDYGSFPLSAPYDKGRTMTHEVGHYLGLYHTFQGGCTGVGDEVADTPAVSSPNYGCPAGTDSCPFATGVDMIENYMDYTDDTCMNIFTNGQKTRITSVLSTYVNRNTLATSDGATPLADVGNDAAVKFNCYDVSGCVASTQPTIIITNWGTATLTAATISYDFDGNNAQTYSWSGSLAYGAYAEVTLPAISVSGTVLNINITNANGSADQRSCNNSISKTFSPAPTYSTAQVHLELLTDNYCEETSWEFIDGSGTVIYSGGPYTQNTQDNTTFNYDFDVNTNECYSFVIYDEYGDGICCDYGTGSYELTTDDATVIFSGGNFGSSETTNLTVQTLSTDDFSLANSIFLYPNPTSSILNIKTKGELPDGFIIYNMLGQKVASRTIISQADLVIKTENLSNGMYFVKITQGGSQVSLPFVKQ